MATNSKHRKGHKEKVAARNRQQLQQKAHKKHRLNRMIEEMIKNEQERLESESKSTTDETNIVNAEVVTEAEVVTDVEIETEK